MPELRHDDAGAINEVVARGADVHLERMDLNGWLLIITEQDGAETRISIGRAVGFGMDEVVATVVETTGAGPAREQGNGWVER